MGAQSLRNPHHFTVQRQPGELCRSVLETARQMSSVERQDKLGSSVLLVGVVDVDLSESLSSSEEMALACSVVASDINGSLMLREKKGTRTVGLQHQFASYDEVFAFGGLYDADCIHSLTVSGA
jgi:hypothetical protein